jgi:hypothetical protein
MVTPTQHGITYLSTVPQEDHSARTPKALWVISRLWAYAPYLPERDRLVMPPWEDPAAVMSDFLGTNDDTPDGENSVAIVHPAVMAPLLVWALRTVLDLSPDILAAAREHRRLLATIPDRAPRGGTETAVAHLRGLLAAGQQLPSSGAPGATAVRARFGGPLPPMANTFLAGTLGVTTSQVARARSLLTDELTPADFGPAPRLDVPLAARIGAAPWREQVGFDDVDVLMLHLSTAALICCAYLSGMRPEEVLALRRGCCTRAERDDGTVRFEIRGRHFKGVLDENGNAIGEGEQRADPWIVLEPVARAIAVVEELEDGEQLFTRTLYRYAKGTCMPRTGLSSDTAVQRIRAFTAWANQLAAAHDRPHELIPPDPGGAVALRRFRRTIAWFIYRQPGGRIALAVQYGHAATAMSESYAGRSKADMLEVLDQEKGLALAEPLTEASERLAAGEKVSGPAADRYRAAAVEFSDRYAGTYLGRRELRALVANPRLQVYEDPKAFLTCNHDAFTALCNPTATGCATAAAAPRTTPAATRRARTSAAPTARSPPCAPRSHGSTRTPTPASTPTPSPPANSSARTTSPPSSAATTPSSRPTPNPRSDDEHPRRGPARPARRRGAGPARRRGPHPRPGPCRHRGCRGDQSHHRRHGAPADRRPAALRQAS